MNRNEGFGSADGVTVEPDNAQPGQGSKAVQESPPFRLSSNLTFRIAGPSA